MTPWVIRAYVTEEHRFLLSAWYGGLEPHVQAALDVVLGVLRQTPDWLDPKTDLFKELVERHAGLSEIRFYVDEPRPRQHPTRRRFRVPGIYRPTNRDFIAILGCEKQGMNAIPPNTFDDALRYMNEFAEGRGWTYEYF